MVSTMASGKSAGTAGRKTGWNTYIVERAKMKALVEIVLIWGIVLALVLAVFLLNFWLIHRIDLLVGVDATRAIIAVGTLMATIWIFGHNVKKS